ncbi:MAG: S8 family peptidase [Parcubacteria group bacterium]|nr:S8 family peptidase [Parcubacteria group bacterium]
MKKIAIGLGLAVAVSAVTLGLAIAQGGEGGNQKIVVFSTALNDAAKDELITRVGGVKLKNLDLIGAKAVWLPSKAAVQKLQSAAHVVRVDEDVIVSAFAQTLPWGIDRVDAELVWPSGNTADPVKVGIVDTGISNKHPDLLANVKGGVNTINSKKGWNDDNGHGSHVAGTVAAINDASGVVGAAPAADLYAIKVLGANGSGYLSDVIEGIQWGVTNGMQILNMSLGTASNILSFEEAVQAAKTAGVTLVAAAGNSGGAVNYPAAYQEVIAVSATDQNNVIASFSSRGPEVDLAAPGVSILSTYKGTLYATMSGTSMAAPHVTGAAALVMNTAVGASDANGNGKWDPDEVQTKLQATVTDLGDLGFDNLYGWGLVNAFAAVQ